MKKSFATDAACTVTENLVDAAPMVAVAVAVPATVPKVIVFDVMPLVSVAVVGLRVPPSAVHVTVRQEEGAEKHLYFEAFKQDEQAKDAGEGKQLAQAGSDAT